VGAVTAPAATLPLAAALLRRALPGLAALDLAALSEVGGGLYPWMPEALCGVAEPGSLAPAERALLSGFRQRGGARPLFGLDPHADSAFAAGASEAWGGAGDRLVVVAGGGAAGAAAGAGAWLGRAGAMVLARDAAPPTAARVMLLLGAGGTVERLDLLLPDGGGGRSAAALLPALEAAARGLAEAAGGAPGWEFGARAISPRLAALTLLAPDPLVDPAVLPAEALILDAEGGRDEGGGGGPAGPRLRLLLGVLPPRPLRLRLLLRDAGRAPPVLFLDGIRHASRTEVGPAGGMLLEARIAPRVGALPTVLGLALPAGAGAAPGVARLEIGAA
jgi:hypothetical protein